MTIIDANQRKYAHFYQVRVREKRQAALQDANMAEMKKAKTNNSSAKSILVERVKTAKHFQDLLRLHKRSVQKLQ